MTERRTHTLVGVRLTRSSPVQFFDAGDLELAVGDRVLVQTESGDAEARVVIAPQQVIHNDLKGTALPPVLRKV